MYGAILHFAHRRTRGKTSLRKLILVKKPSRARRFRRERTAGRPSGAGRRPGPLSGVRRPRRLPILRLPSLRPIRRLRRRRCGPRGSPAAARNPSGRPETSLSPYWPVSSLASASSMSCSRVTSRCVKRIASSCSRVCSAASSGSGRFSDCSATACSRRMRPRSSSRARSRRPRRRESWLAESPEEDSLPVASMTMTRKSDWRRCQDVLEVVPRPGETLRGVWGAPDISGVAFALSVVHQKCKTHPRPRSRIPVFPRPPSCCCSPVPPAAAPPLHERRRTERAGTGGAAAPGSGDKEEPAARRPGEASWR